MDFGSLWGVRGVLGSSRVGEIERVAAGGVWVPPPSSRPRSLMPGPEGYSYTGRVAVASPGKTSACLHLS